MTTLTERELTFTFPTTWKAERFDIQGRALPKHIAPVDFVVESEDRLFLIEVKDPSMSTAPVSEQQHFLKKMLSHELTHEELVPIARTTWSYLHLMDRTAKPIVFIIAIGSEQLSVQPPLWTNLADRLRKRLAHEAPERWQRHYVHHCLVVPALELGRHLPGVSVTRHAPAPP